MQRVLITGAGRGIGLAVALQYAQRGDRVLAGCRSIERSPELQRVAAQYADSVSIVPLEVTDAGSIAAAVQQAHAEVDGLDVLYNNAAINPGDIEVDGPDGQRVLDPDRMVEVIRANAIAPLIVAQSFRALLLAGQNPRVINVSSGAGSLTFKTDGGDYSYGASKAALNMLTRAFAFDVQPHGITAVAIDPGWVKTDMGGEGAELEPEVSARGLQRVADGLTTADAGRYLRYDGTELPW